jgi:hypothetical protein
MVEQCVRFIATAWLKSKETEAFLRQLTEERIRKLSLQLALDGVSKRDDRSMRLQATAEPTEQPSDAGHHGSSRGELNGWRAVHRTVDKDYDPSAPVESVTRYDVPKVARRTQWSTS